MPDRALKPPKRVYLHIGRGKTGTTAIQRFCSRNRDALAAQGIRYVHAGDDGRGVGHQELAQSFLPTIPEWMEVSDRVHDIQRATTDELSCATDPAFLISSENLTLVDPSLVKKYFNDLWGAVSFHIIFFSRSQDELVESQYNQLVKWSGETASFAQFIANPHLEELDYEALIAPWSACFGASNIIARVYDAAAHSVIPTFLSCLSLSVSSFQMPTDRENRSFGYLAIEIARFLNGFELSDRRRLYAEIAALVEKQDMPGLFFSASAARTFRSRFFASNLRFSKQHLGAPMAELGGRRYSDAERDNWLEARARLDDASAMDGKY